MQNDHSNNFTEIPFLQSYMTQFANEQAHLQSQTMCDFASEFEEPWMPRKQELSIRYHDDTGGPEHFWSEAARATTITSSDQLLIPHTIPRFSIPEDAMTMDREWW
uniref:Uncharacterized protein n=1 Tax=Clandestinovirus TaxID=2831644 RepID=A0A8F8PKG5_9VIRU|nr:hypothetical protein KOM_12_488 [Clandestinovirus]